MDGEPIHRNGRIERGERVKPLSGNVRVVNPKQIRSVVLGSTDSRLDSREMQQIAHQLEQRCRDVEF